MGKRKAMKGYQKLPFVLDAAMGAVGDGAFVGADIGDTVNDRMWNSSVRATFGLRDYTVGEGPVTAWVAHSDYGNTEVAAAILAQQSWDLGDLVAREVAGRKVRQIGTFAMRDEGEEVLFDGRQRTVKTGWMLEAGDTLQFGLLANSGALTSGAQLGVTGYANAWRR